MAWSPPFGFKDHGDSIHVSPGNGPHLSGEIDGHSIHINYYGQTTLGMFDRNLGAHRLLDVERLYEQFPDVFKDSGLRWP